MQNGIAFKDMLFCWRVLKKIMKLFYTTLLHGILSSYYIFISEKANGQHGNICIN